MQNRQSHASSLFLLELILAILFFSIASAVCVQLFVKAHLLSTDSRALNRAVSECASAAETIDAASSAEEALALLTAEYPSGIQSAGEADTLLTVYYDGDFNPADAQTAAYRFCIRLNETDGLLTASAGFEKTSDGSSVYMLTASHHVNRRISE